uniref:Putative metalloproteinase n=1 Tax=Tityus obscurus TaxID=1221240 RepID=A0A1E1WVW9_TITOB
MNLAYIFFLFATVSAIPTGREDVVFPSVETSRSGVKTIKFRALGEDIELKLEPAGGILSKDFALYNGNKEKDHSVDVESLRRRIYRDSANGAALIIDDDHEKFPSIRGVVNSKLRIEPHELGGTTQYGRNAHRIIELTSEGNSYFSDNVIPPKSEIEARNFTGMARPDKCIVVEFLCLTESKFTERFKTNKELTDYVTTMYTGVQNMYDTMNLGIVIRLSGIQAFTKKDEPSYIKDSEVLKGKYLDDKILANMRSYYCKNSVGLAKDADIIMLFVRRLLVGLTGSKITSKVLGIAYSAGLCHKCDKVGVTLDETDYNERIITLAHESAHLLGVPHDGMGTEEVDLKDGPGAKSCPYDDGYIMGTAEAANMLKFSKCSAACAKYFLSLPQASCAIEDCKSSR